MKGEVDMYPFPPYRIWYLMCGLHAVRPFALRGRNKLKNVESLAHLPTPTGQTRDRYSKDLSQLIHHQHTDNIYVR